MIYDILVLLHIGSFLSVSNHFTILIPTDGSDDDWYTTPDDNYVVTNNLIVCKPSLLLLPL